MDVVGATRVMLDSYLNRLYDRRVYTLMKVSHITFLRGDIMLLWANLHLDTMEPAFMSVPCVALMRADFYALAEGSVVETHLGSLFLSERFNNGELV